MNITNELQRRIVTRLKDLDNDDGMSTIEYAMGSLAAAALAAALYLVVSGNSVSEALDSIITNALNNAPG